jgi:hypothetical protein
MRYDGGNTNSDCRKDRSPASGRAATPSPDLRLADLHAEIDRRVAEIRRGLRDGSIRWLIPFFGDVPPSDWRPTRPGPQGHNAGITPVAPRNRTPAREELLRRVAEVERVIRAMVREIAALKTRGVA